MKAWENRQASKQSQQSPPPQGWLKWGNIVTAIATLAIAGLGIFQGWAMHRQRKAMDAQAAYMRDALAETKKSADAAESSAKTARESLEIGYRARVAIRNLRLVGGPQAVLKNDEKLFRSSVHVGFENVGQTNAQAFHYQLEIDIPGATRLSRSPRPEVSKPSELHPGSRVTAMSGEIQQYFNRLDIQKAVVSGTLEARGFIRYKDVFGHSYFVEFRSIKAIDSPDFLINVAEKIEG